MGTLQCFYMRAWSRITMTAVIGASLVATSLTGAAYAFLKSTGSGTTSGSVGTSLAVTLATNATPASALQPGGTGSLVITATNPNAYDVQITDLAITGVSGCGTPALSLVTPKTYLPATIPAGGVPTRINLNDALAMGNSSSDCQNKPLTVTLTPTVRR